MAGWLCWLARYVKIFEIAGNNHCSRLKCSRSFSLCVSSEQPTQYTTILATKNNNSIFCIWWLQFFCMSVVCAVFRCWLLLKFDVFGLSLCPGTAWKKLFRSYTSSMFLYTFFCHCLFLTVSFFVVVVQFRSILFRRMPFFLLVFFKYSFFQL